MHAMSVSVEPAGAWSLVELLDAPEVGRRMSAVLQLRALGSEAGPALERGLSCHGSDGVRRWCAHLLGELCCADGGAAAALVAATHDRTAAVRMLAVQTLADPERSAALGVDPVPHLVRMARFDRSKRVRGLALRGLRMRLPDPRAAATLAGNASGRLLLTAPSL